MANPITVCVYGYIRVSTDTQVETGQGMDMQRNAIQAYVRTHNMTLTEIFEDAGISGAADEMADAEEAVSKRVGLLKLLDVVKSADTVIVLNTSRLWRSDMVKAIIKRALMKRGARVVSVEQPRYDIYNRDPNEVLISAIMEALDQWEHMSIALKFAKGRATKALKGNKPAGACPYGYRYGPDKCVIIDLQEAQVIRRMFSEGQRGRSIRAIASGLTTDGIRTRGGKEWSAAGIHVILRNDFYIGVLTHQGQKIAGNHEAIISRVQFGKVSSQLKSRRKVG